jgi:hypothetical protein
MYLHRFTLNHWRNRMNKLYDILTAVAIGLLLTVGALAYFDILWG